MKRLLTLLSVMIALSFSSLYAEQVYLNENFNGGTLNGWTSIDNDGKTVATDNPIRSSLGFTTYGWGALVIETAGDYSALSTSYYTPAGTADDWLISPEIQVGTGAKLMWQGQALNSGYPDGYKVYVSTTGADIANFTTVLLDVPEEGGSMTTHVLDFSAYAGQTVRIAFQNYSNDMYILGIDNVKCFTPNPFDAYNLQISNKTFSKLDAQGLAIAGTIANLGGTTITSIDVSYQIDNETPVTATLSVNIPYYQAVTYTLPTKWLPTDFTKSYIMKTWVSNINGSTVNIDSDYTNDTLTTTIYPCNSTNSKDWANPLIEEFTSSSCTPCASLNTWLNPTIETNKEYISVCKYQMNWPNAGDPYYNADGGIRKTYYAVEGVPSLHFIGGDATYSQAGFDALRLEPELYDIVGTYKIDETLKNVIVDFSLTCLSSFFTNNSVTAHVAVVETKTTDNASTNGETEFHFVEQKMLPNGNGTVVTAKTPQATQSANNLSYTFLSTDHVEEMSDLAVVLFVQDNASKRILGSAWAVLDNSDVKNDNSGNGIVALFPNPANETSRVRYQVRDNQNVNIDLFNINGEPVLSMEKGNLSAGVYFEDFNVKNLANGQYIVKITIGDKSYSTTLNVVK